MEHLDQLQPGKEEKCNNEWFSEEPAQRDILRQPPWICLHMETHRFLTLRYILQQPSSTTTAEVDCKNHIGSSWLRARNRTKWRPSTTLEIPLSQLGSTALMPSEDSFCSLWIGNKLNRSVKRSYFICLVSFCPWVTRYDFGWVGLQVWGS